MLLGAGERSVVVESSGSLGTGTVWITHCPTHSCLEIGGTSSSPLHVHFCLFWLWCNNKQISITANKESSKAKILLLGSCHSLFLSAKNSPVSTSYQVVYYLENGQLLHSLKLAGLGSNSQSLWCFVFKGQSFLHFPPPHSLYFFTDLLLAGMQVTIENILNLVYTWYLFMFSSQLLLAKK